MTDNIDPATVPTELRKLWSTRGAAKRAASAGVLCQTRDGIVSLLVPVVPCSAPFPTVKWTDVEAEMRRQGLDPDAELAKATAAYSTTSPCKCGGPAALVSYGDRGTVGPLRRICSDCIATGSAVGGGL